MKSSKLKDILDFDKTKWDIIFGKLKKLATAIEMKKGPSMNIDDHDYRFVNDVIEYYESEDRLLTKDDFDKANELWRIYG